MKREPIRPIHEGPNQETHRVSLVLMPNVQHPGGPAPIDYDEFCNGGNEYPGYKPVVFTMTDTPDNRKLLDYIGEMLNGAAANSGLIVSVSNQPVYGGATHFDNDDNPYTDWGSLQIYEEHTNADGYTDKMVGGCYWVEWQPEYGVGILHN